VNGPRRQAREAALQSLYFWEVGRSDPSIAIESFFAEHAADAPEIVRSFASELVLGTVGEIAELDAVIEQHSKRWRLERLAVIDRLILRMAIWELRHTRDVPAAVVINEAVELARRFSTEDAVRFVNGVLDAIRKAMEADASGA
jgi:N utilization substance protein B